MEGMKPELKLKKNRSKQGAGATALQEERSSAVSLRSARSPLEEPASCSAGAWEIGFAYQPKACGLFLKGKGNNQSQICS